MSQLSWQHRLAAACSLGRRNVLLLNWAIWTQKQPESSLMRWKHVLAWRWCLIPPLHVPGCLFCSPHRLHSARNVCSSYASTSECISAVNGKPGGVSAYSGGQKQTASQAEPEQNGLTESNCQPQIPGPDLAAVKSHAYVQIAALNWKPDQIPRQRIGQHGVKIRGPRNRRG